MLTKRNLFYIAIASSLMCISHQAFTEADLAQTADSDPKSETPNTETRAATPYYAETRETPDTTPEMDADDAETPSE